MSLITGSYVSLAIDCCLCNMTGFQGTHVSTRQGAPVVTCKPPAKPLEGCQAPFHVFWQAAEMRFLLQPHLYCRRPTW